MERPLIIAHRGVSSLAKENTLSAFHLAEKMQVDLIECDLHLSKDRIPVIIHDDTIHGLKVCDLTFAELQQFDIPQLSDLLPIKCKFLLELKAGDGIADIVLEMAPPDALIGSFSADLIQKVPISRRIGIAETEQEMEAHKKLGTKQLALHESLPFSKELAPLIWTVDDPVNAKEFFKKGASGIITNAPQKLFSTFFRRLPYLATIEEKTCIELEGRSIAIFRHLDHFFALDNLCPHKGAPLVEGKFENNCIVCPWHHWKFELQSGLCLTGGRVKTYPIMRHQNDLFIGI